VKESKPTGTFSLTPATKRLTKLLKAHVNLSAEVEKLIIVLAKKHKLK